MLGNPASVGQQVLAVIFLTSVDWSPLCPTLIFSLPPSANCVLHLTAISSDWSLLLTVLFSPPLSTDSLSSLGLSFPRRLPVSWEMLRQNKGILWLASTHTETEATHSVTSMTASHDERKVILWCPSFLKWSSNSLLQLAILIP